jgi:hypothetical protein
VYVSVLSVPEIAFKFNTPSIIVAVIIRTEDLATKFTVGRFLLFAE